MTALGTGWKTNALGFRNGTRAFQKVTLFDTARQRVQMAGEVQLPSELPQTRLNSREKSRLDRATRMLLLATHEAWHEAGLLPSENLPFVLGTTSGGMSEGETYYRQAIATPRQHRRQPTRVMQYQAQLQGQMVGRALGFHGPITILANACASGSNAIGHAFSLVRFRQAECVLAGGYDGLSQLVFAGFDSLQALSPTECRPFDAQRNGLALGEGAAVLALETLEHAQQRGAVILGEVAGYGAATDCHHLTQPHPAGDAALASMQKACASAQVGPEQIGYINAHGTGTPLNDSAEASAINRWAGTQAGNMRVSSTKASIGHLLGAAGAVEAVICLMALREQWLPPMKTLETPDPAVQFGLVTESRDARVEHALSNSFGFGGSNATLVFRRWV
ncbi:MAG: Beta-ketoacyl synthase [Verrucomicrobiales bacterium]|nr:Beta-ketoacyl synthase [Verrucomicrobiales bacterium]